MSQRTDKTEKPVAAPFSTRQNRVVGRANAARNWFGSPGHCETNTQADLFLAALWPMPARQASRETARTAPRDLLVSSDFPIRPGLVASQRAAAWRQHAVPAAPFEKPMRPQ